MTQIRAVTYNANSIRTAFYIDEEVKIALLSNQGQAYEVLQDGNLVHFIVIDGGKSPRKLAG